MPRSRNTRNMERVSDETPSQRRARRTAESHGRGRNQAYTSGARSSRQSNDTVEAMREAWNRNRKPVALRNERTGRFDGRRDNGTVDVYSRSARGMMSTTPGGRAGGSTNTFTDKDNGRQTGRGMQNRTVRYQEVRRSLNNVGDAVSRIGGVEGLRARGLTDAEIRNIYGGGNGGGQALSVG